MRYRHTYSGLLLFVLALTVHSGVAQSQSAPIPIAPLAPALPPDASQAQRQIDERNAQLQKAQNARPDVRLKADAPTQVSNQVADQGPADAAQRIPDGEQPCFRIDSVQVQTSQASTAAANSASSSDSWAWLLGAIKRDKHGELDDPKQRCLGTQSVNVLTARAQDAVIAKGYSTTRVLVGAQDLKQGVLNLTVVEGRVGAIVPHPDNSAANNARLNMRTALGITQGEVIQLRDIEQGLDNLKRVPTAQADIQIAPSGNEQPGLSDLRVKYSQEPSDKYRFAPFRYTVSADDSGSKGTGKISHTHTLNWDNPLSANDLLYISYIRDLSGRLGTALNNKSAGQRGTANYAVHYSVPFGNWLWAVNATQSSYHQFIAGAFTDYTYSGNSASQDIKATALLHRDAQSKTYFSTKLWSKQSQNFIDTTEVEVQRRRTGGFELGLTHKRSWGDTTLDVNLGYRRGTGLHNALEAPESAFGEGDSHPKIITLDGSFSHPFTAGVPLKFATSWRAQWHRSPLIPADRFSVGGRGTVRGYDGQMILSTERGYVIRSELEAPIAQSGWAAYLAYDYGHVGGETAQYMLTDSLQSVALGLRLQGKGWLQGLSLDSFIGQPLNKVDGFRAKRHAYGFNLNWGI